MMKGILSVFGKSVAALAIVVSLTASGCNTRRNDSMKVRESKDGDKEVQIKQHRENDSVTVKKDIKVETDRDNNRGMGSDDRNNDNSVRKNDDNTNKR